MGPLSPVLSKQHWALLSQVALEEMLRAQRREAGACQVSGALPPLFYIHKAATWSEEASQPGNSEGLGWLVPLTVYPPTRAKARTERKFRLAVAGVLWLLADPSMDCDCRLCCAHEYSFILWASCEWTYRGGGSCCLSELGSILLSTYLSFK